MTTSVIEDYTVVWTDREMTNRDILEVEKAQETQQASKFFPFMERAIESITDAQGAAVDFLDMPARLLEEVVGAHPDFQDAGGTA